MEYCDPNYGLIGSFVDFGPRIVKVLKKILKHPNKPDVNAKDEEGS